MKRVYFCPNCFFFGYGREFTYSAIYDGLGDNHGTTDEALEKIHCPDCYSDVLSLEVDEETVELLRRAVKTLSELEGDYYGELGDEFDFYQDVTFSRVLTYLSLKRGKNIARAKVERGKIVHEPLDGVLELVLAKKFEVAHPHEVELARALEREDCSVQLIENISKDTKRKRRKPKKV